MNIKPTVYIKTHGCKLNQSDTLTLNNEFHANGYELTHNEEDAIHGSEFKADWCTWLIENVETRGNFLDLPQGFSCKPIDDVIVVIRADHASIVVENGDTTDYYLTILRQLD